MKKILMLSALSFMFATSSVFAACPCMQKKLNTCDPCAKPKVTCCQPACPDQSYQGQCCNKKSLFKRLWSGTKTAYDNSFGAIYNTIADPFR